MRKALVSFVGLVVLGLLLAPINAAVTGINSSNTVIVLPTTKIVNGVPLHIGEDAISGSRLGAFLVLRGISQGTYTKTVFVPVEYHSVLIADENQTYKLNSRDMPDVGLNVSEEPVGKGIVIQVNFSRVDFNSTKKAAEFKDRSVEIVFNENTTPLDIGGNYKVVSTTVNGKDTMYFYSALNVSGVSSSLGDTLSVGAWSIKFVDINVNQEEMLVDLTYPSGLLKQKTMEKNSYYIMYVDANGNEDFEPFSTYPESRINELLESGVRNLFVFTPTGFFVGIGGTKSVIYDYQYYEKVKQYGDGDVYSGQWVWDIDPANNLYVLYLHVNESAGFKRVFAGEGSSVKLPTDWGLELRPLFTKNDKGEVTGVEGYRFVRVTSVKKTVSVVAPKIEATDDVYKFIINDTELTSLPSDKNVIIVGGWVSNKAWALLEQVYGNETINSIKDEVMKKGYVVKELNNPHNSRYKVIILAGKTHEETAIAVEEFMRGM
ncbi:S-layer protein [Thermococcus celer]|uniref:S-layer protein n=1 Tax=Thermococcus celer Vu 13 = JCM 8558 TaxID=1293037 RepID=A0A218P021_THECE|nr:S-layer protein [Thermococcus celer]ASI98278.1 S-layer protein [Thermococcus celer] [Thermococcus celer Vu 13 = JCM 8558]